MYRKILILIVVFTLHFSMQPGMFAARAGKKDSARESCYKSLETLASRDLVKYGKECLDNRSTHKNALEAFSIIIGRYYKGSASIPTEVSDVVESLHHVGTLYLVSYFKYDKAYKYLSLAQQLAEENHMTRWLPYIYVNLANLWEINRMIFPGTTCDGFKYVADAWDAAVAGKNEDLLPRIAFNMAILTYTEGADKVFHSQITDFLDYKFSRMNSDCEIAKEFVKGVRLWMSRNYEDGERHLLSSLEKVRKIVARDTVAGHGYKRNDYGKRQILSILSALAEFYISEQRYGDANSMLREYGSWAKDNPDFAIDLHELYVKYFKALNINDSVDKYHYLYLKGKDAISNESKLYEVGEKLFIDKIEKINDEVISLAGKNRRQRFQLGAAFVALLLLLSLIAVALWAYIRVRNKSAQLYRKNVEMIEEQIQFMARHRLLQDEVERLRVLSEGKDVCKNQQTDASCDSAATGDADDVQTDVARSQPRSIIADADAEILYSRIVEVMEKGGDVYQPEFSLERLSALAESRPRVVSQVINMKTGSNFSKFLNEYRIREACIRFQNTQQYGNYTVEAIAESVGYRSRTGFSSLFKKATGLSPSEYHRQAKRASGK